MINLIIYLVILIITNYIFYRINRNNIIIISILTFILLLVPFILSKSITMFFLYYLINNIINLFIVKINKYKFKEVGKILISVFIILNITIFLELTLFNFRSYTSLSNNPIHLNKLNINTNTNLTKINDKKYLVTNTSSYIEIKDINTHIENIYFDIVNNVSDCYTIKPFYTDDPTSSYTELSEREIYNLINKSKILNFDLSGNTNKLNFLLTFPEGSVIQINDIIINYRIPFEFNMLRFVLTFLIILFVYIFRPKSFIYNLEFSKYKYSSILFSIFFIVVSFVSISKSFTLNFGTYQNDIYNMLTNSFIDGKVYIEDENHSEKLLNTLDNPYDYITREKIFKNKNENYLWDFAFYKGKYYSYYGVVPTILFYLPYKIITHIDLPTNVFISIISLVTAILLLCLFYQIVDKYFNNLSLGIYFLLNFALIFCTGLLYFLKIPDIYSVPLVSSLLFIYLGLNLFFLILKNNKHTNLKIFFGSFSLALVAGCRPHLILSSLFILPIMILYYKENKFNKKDLIKKIIIIILPYIIVAYVLMYYNYIRFESVFDFGANYNLTTNDMTHRGFKLGRIPIGLKLYLFDFINTKNIFPYLDGTAMNTNYLGILIYEKMYGGIFFSIALTSINLFIFKLRNYLNSKIVYYTCLSCLICSLLIIILDIEVAGMLPRYFIDFSWLMVFSSVLIILSLSLNNKINSKYIIYAVFILVSLSLIYQFFYFFVDFLDEFKIKNLKLWYEFYYTFQFWI